MWILENEVSICPLHIYESGFQTLIISSTGKIVRQRELSYIFLVLMQNGADTSENRLLVSHKVKHEVTTW